MPSAVLAGLPPLDGLLDYDGESLAASRGLFPQQVHSKVQPAIFASPRS